MQDQWSKKLRKKLAQPLYLGILAKPRKKEMRRVIGYAGDPENGAAIQFYLIVDEEDGVIADISYQLFAPPLLLALAEITSELIMRKTYLQASRLSADLIDKEGRDHPFYPSFPEEGNSSVNLILCAVEEACEKCMDIPLTEESLQTPFSLQKGETFTLPSSWSKLDKKEKISLIDQLLTQEVRPYIELDAGGIEIIDLEEKKLIISYQGACTSCYAATGSTLSAIQQIIQAKIDPEMIVEPKL